MHTLCCLEYEGGREEVKGKGGRGRGERERRKEKGERRGGGAKMQTKSHVSTNPQTTSGCIQLVG